MQQDPTWRLYPRMQVNLGMTKRHGDELEHLFDAGLDPAEVGHASRGRGVCLGCIAPARGRAGSLSPVVVIRTAAQLAF